MIVSIFPSKVIDKENPSGLLIHDVDLNGCGLRRASDSSPFRGKCCAGICNPLTRKRVSPRDQSLIVYFPESDVRVLHPPFQDTDYESVSSRICTYGRSHPIVRSDGREARRALCSIRVCPGHLKRSKKKRHNDENLGKKAV